MLIIVGILLILFSPIAFVLTNADLGLYTFIGGFVILAYGIDLSKINASIKQLTADLNDVADEFHEQFPKPKSDETSTQVIGNISDKHEPA